MATSFSGSPGTSGEDASALIELMPARVENKHSASPSSNRKTTSPSPRRSDPPSSVYGIWRKQGVGSPRKHASPRKKQANPAHVSHEHLVDVTVAGDVEGIRAVLDSFPDLVHAQDKCGLTVLHEAARHGQPAAMEVLCEYGADIEATTNARKTALLLATDYGRLACAKWLLQHGANVDAWDEEYNTALHIAAWKNRIKILEELLRHGATVEMENKYKSTPFRLASNNGNAVIVILLGLTRYP